MPGRLGEITIGHGAIQETLAEEKIVKRILSKTIKPKIK
jgi:hypothetical protein